MFFENTILSILTRFDINFLMNALELFCDFLLWIIVYKKKIKLVQGTPTTRNLCSLGSQFVKFIKATVTDVSFIKLF